MVHTTTKNSRNKRPDTRPNGKVRAKLSKKIEAEKKIQDLRVTRKQKDEKVEREQQKTELKKKIPRDEKYVRALRKKLAAIEQLLEKQKSGISLDDQQLEKIARLDELMEEMDSITGISTD